MNKKSSQEKSSAGLIVMFTLDQQIDRRILLEADSLEAEEGWQVIILAPSFVAHRDREDRRVIRLANNESVQQPGNVLATTMHNFLQRFLPFNGFAMKWLRAIGWPVMRGNPGHFYPGLFADAIQRFPADVYVAHDLPMLPVAASAAARHAGKMVYDSHELFPEQDFCFIERRMWESLERRLIHRPDAVITVNASIASELKKRYGLTKVTVVHNAERIVGDMPSRRRLFHEFFNLPDEACILLFQGGLTSGRNLETLVRSAACFQARNVHLVLLGDGSLGEALKTLAKRLGIASRVHFHPLVPQEKLLAYTTSADVGIIPYQATCLNNYFCTPNKLFEFIAAGLPVIATDLPELHRIIVDNGIGVVGKTTSAREIASLVDQVFSEWGQQERYRDAAMASRSRINWQNESRHLLEVYRTLR